MDAAPTARSQVRGLHSVGIQRHSALASRWDLRQKDDVASSFHDRPDELNHPHTTQPFSSLRSSAARHPWPRLPGPLQRLSLRRSQRRASASLSLSNSNRPNARSGPRGRSAQLRGHHVPSSRHLHLRPPAPAHQSAGDAMSRQPEQSAASPTDSIPSACPFAARPAAHGEHQD